MDERIEQLRDVLTVDVQGMRNVATDEVAIALRLTLVDGGRVAVAIDIEVAVWLREHLGQCIADACGAGAPPLGAA